MTWLMSVFSFGKIFRVHLWLSERLSVIKCLNFFFTNTNFSFTCFSFFTLPSLSRCFFSLSTLRNKFNANTLLPLFRKREAKADDDGNDDDDDNGVDDREKKIENSKASHRNGNPQWPGKDWLLILLFHFQSAFNTNKVAVKARKKSATSITRRVQAIISVTCNRVAICLAGNR